MSKEYNYDGYDYAVYVTLRDPGEIKTGELTKLNSSDPTDPPISLQKQKENVTGTFNYCDIESYADNWIINVTNFEKELGGLFSIEFEAKADCDGEIFDISGQYNTRLSAQYTNLFLE